jgi:hypothetical protein
MASSRSLCPKILQIFAHFGGFYLLRDARLSAAANHLKSRQRVDGGGDTPVF